MFDLLLFFLYMNVYVYAFVLLLFIIGLLKNFFSKNNVLTNDIDSVSVIVCVKNEELVIRNLLHDLKKQNFKGDLEFIIVDDNSSDDSKKIINQFVSIDSRFKYVSSDLGSKSLSFKKKAIDAGIKVSKNNYLIFTDSGCSLNENWIHSIMSNYSNDVNFVVGLSFVNSSSNLVSKFQKIDLLMLMISTLSSFNLNYPLASTGQNISYKKNLFKSVNGFSKISNLLMGDDSIFMHLCLKYNKAKVVVSSSPESFVNSKIIFKWKDFFFQRLRWAGDGTEMWKFNKLFFIIMLATFFSNLFFLISPFVYYNSIKFLVIIFCLKFILEFTIYCLGIFLFNFRFVFLDFIYWFIIQIPYVVLVAIMAPFSRRLGWR